MRLDILLTEKKLAKSRSAANALIKQGSVLVDGVAARKPSQEVATSAEIIITEQLPYVSRSGIKLAQALDHFGIEVAGKTAIDIGASTGGFTDCLLQRDIAIVYSVDVGTNQLDETIRSNSKVVVMEQTDIRDAIIPEKVDLVVVDLSFISLSHVLKKIHILLKPSGTAVLLIKPQFEVGKENIGKKGIVSDHAQHQIAIDRLMKEATELSFKTHEIIESPITGSTGNVEYLTYLTK